MTDDWWEDAEVLEALDEVRQSRHDIHDVAARVAWSVLAEPGDGDAGRAIAERGPVEGLRAVGIGERDADATSHESRARWTPRRDRAAVLSAIRHAGHVGATLVVPGDPAWPLSLDDLGPHSPIVLWVRGDAGVLSQTPRVALVGARASSGYGEMLAREFAGDLAVGGAVVVSGGAYGIDGAAHRAALDVGGQTVAFLAGGVDRAYPQGHRDLLRRITDTGAVVSEVPCGTAPTKWRFLARNRLIAALSDATVVVEAGWRSGSLNTAGHAAALGRPLGTVPGPVTSATSSGCHRLLREYDARCVTTAGEIRELWGETGPGSSALAPEDPDRRRLLDALGSKTTITTSDISRRSGLSVARVVSLLGLLELDGEVTRNGDRWRRR